MPKRKKKRSYKMSRRRKSGEALLKKMKAQLAVKEAYYEKQVPKLQAFRDKVAAYEARLIEEAAAKAARQAEEQQATEQGQEPPQQEQPVEGAQEQNDQTPVQAA
jgi:ribosomal protein RSM22 (predicted rRNA methylase)